MYVTKTSVVNNLVNSIRHGPSASLISGSRKSDRVPLPVALLQTDCVDSTRNCFTNQGDTFKITQMSDEFNVCINDKLFLTGLVLTSVGRQ